MAKDDDSEKVKKAYEKAAKKFKLPKFADMEREFEISRSKDPQFIVKDLSRSMARRLSEMINAFMPVLQPRQDSLHSLAEMSTFSKAERHELYLYYRRVNHLAHLGHELYFESDKDHAAYIKKIWKEWPALKKTYKKFCTKITKEWAKPMKVSEHRSDYLG